MFFFVSDCKPFLELKQVTVLSVKWWRLFIGLFYSYILDKEVLRKPGVVSIQEIRQVENRFNCLREFRGLV